MKNLMVFFGVFAIMALWLVLPGELRGQDPGGCFICECEEGNCDLQDCEPTPPGEGWGTKCTTEWDEGLRRCWTHGDPCNPTFTATGRLLPSQLSSMGTYFAHHVMDRIRRGVRVDACTRFILVLESPGSELSPNRDAGWSRSEQVLAIL